MTLPETDGWLTGVPVAFKEAGSRDTAASRLFGCSSAVEQSAVNRSVVGSNPTARAIYSSATGTLGPCIRQSRTRKCGCPGR